MSHNSIQIFWGTVQSELLILYSMLWKYVGMVQCHALDTSLYLQHSYDINTGEFFQFDTLLKAKNEYFIQDYKIHKKHI